MKIIRKAVELLRRKDLSLEELKCEVEQKMMLALMVDGVYEKWEYSKEAKTCINHFLTSGKVRLYSYFESDSPEMFNGHIYIKGVWRGTYKMDAGSFQTTGFIEGDEMKFYRTLLKSLNLIPGVVDGYKENQNRGKVLAIHNLINRYQTFKNPLQSQLSIDS